MKHNLHISVSDEPKKKGMVSYKSITLRERILRLLFGKKQKLTILVPGDSISEVAITEIKEGGNAHEKN